VKKVLFVAVILLSSITAASAESRYNQRYGVCQEDYSPPYMIISPPIVAKADH